MKKSIFLFSLVLFGFLAPAQKGNSNHSLLWKISGKDLKTPSYLFGTIHMICPDQYFWTDTMKSAFSNTKALYLELPMADDDFQQQMLQHLMLTDGRELKDFFKERQYNKLDLFFKDSLNMPLAMLQKMKPFGMMSLIYLKHIDCNGQLPIAYEERLLNFAKEQNMPVKGLETIKDQMDIFDRMPNDSIAKMVMSSIEDMAKNRDAFNEMMKAYRQQNIDKLHDLTVNAPDFASKLDEMLYQRNAKWIPRMIAAAQEQPTFFGVGAGHLPGGKGLIQLLRNQGYTVTPVK